MPGAWFVMPGAWFAMPAAKSEESAAKPEVPGLLAEELRIEPKAVWSGGCEGGRRG